MKRLLFAASMVLALAGCGNSGDKQFQKMAAKEIVFPSSLKRIEGTSDRHPDLTVPAVRLVVYVDSVQCSSCNLNRMPQYEQYFSLESQYSDFQLVAMIWPNAETAATMAADIAHRKFPFDVFVDPDGSFMKANPSIPAKRDYHCFLLGRDNRPVMAGDPVSTKGKEMLLHNTLYSIYEKK